jgi:hypothetical protein
MSSGNVRIEDQKQNKMTTNVFDSVSQTLASDTRWSGLVDGYLFFVDDIGYDKIVFDSQIALLFAGGLGIIDQWKAWFRGGRYGVAPALTSDLSLCLIDMKTGQIRKDHGIKLDSPCTSARFAGTGSPHALQCWSIHKDAIKSVETACGFDMRSGGKVTYLIRPTADNNLSNYASAQQVINSFEPAGSVIMTSQKGVPVPIREAIKEPAANEAFKKMLAGGPSSVCAPFIGMGTPWTADEQKEFYDILAEYPPEPQHA